MNELLKLAKEFLKEEIDLRNKIIKDLTYSIINSSKFYVKIGSGWFISLTIKTSELYMFQEFTYQSRGGRPIVNHFINDDGIIINSKEEILPWENLNNNFHEFIYKMNYNEAEKSGLNLKLLREYVDLVKNFIAYCRINAGSYSDYVNYKDYVYLAYIIIEDFEKYE